MHEAANETANWAEFFEVVGNGTLDYDEERWNEIKFNATKSTTESIQNAKDDEFRPDQGIFFIVEVLQLVLYILNYFWRY